jgi:hypothetical protein
MSLFVDQNPAIEIRFKFRMIPDGGIEFLSAESDEECDEIICACKGRDFDTMSRVLEDSTIINHITGAAMVRTRNLYRGIVCNFVKMWNLKDEKTEKQIPITPEVVGQMHDEIPRAIAREWLNKTGRRNR